MEALEEELAPESDSLGLRLVLDPGARPVAMEVRTAYSGYGLAAVRDIRQGETILIEPPLVAVRAGTSGQPLPYREDVRRIRPRLTKPQEAGLELSLLYLSGFLETLFGVAARRELKDFMARFRHLSADFPEQAARRRAQPGLSARKERAPKINTAAAYTL